MGDRSSSGTWHYLSRCAAVLLVCLMVVLLPSQVWASSQGAGPWLGDSTGTSGLVFDGPYNGVPWCALFREPTNANTNGSYVCVNDVQSTRVQMGLAEPVALGIVVTLECQGQSWVNAEAVATMGNGAPMTLYLNDTNGTTGRACYVGFRAPNSSGADVARYAIDPPPPSLCAGGALTATGSYSAGTLGVRVYVPGTFPAGGVRVDAPAPTNAALPATAPTLTLTSTETVDGSPNTYYHSVPLASLSAMTARVWLLDASGNATCSTAMTLQTNPVSPAVTDTTPADNTPPATTSYCGWTLNPLGYLKCLFWPPPGAANGWSPKIADLASRPPINIVVGGVDLVRQVVGLSSCTDSSSNSSASQYTCNGNPYGSPGTATALNAPTQSLDLIGKAGDLVSGTNGGQVAYLLMKSALWIGLAWRVWGRLSSSLGGKG